jgi:hypothetical protein
MFRQWQEIVWLLQWPLFMQLCQGLVKGWEIWDSNSTDIFFSSPNLCDNLRMQAINCCGTVRPIWKVMSGAFGMKHRLKWGDIMTRVWGNLTSVVGKSKWNVNMLRKMHCPQSEGNFCYKHGSTWNQALYKTVTNTSGTQARVTAWQTITSLASTLRNGWNNCSFTFWTFQFWTVIFFSLLVFQK